MTIKINYKKEFMKLIGYLCIKNPEELNEYDELTGSISKIKEHL